MKKKIVSIIMLIMICFSFNTAANAQAVEKLDIEGVAEETLIVSPRADVIEKKYRIHNGVSQYRRWNRTHGYWVDPFWINM